MEMPFGAEVCSLYGIKYPLCKTNAAFEFLNYSVANKHFEVIFNDDHIFHSKEYRRVELLIQIENHSSMYLPVKDVYIAAAQ